MKEKTNQIALHFVASFLSSILSSRAREENPMVEKNMRLIINLAAG